MKKTVSLLVSIIMILSVFCIPCSADDLRKNYDDGKAYFSYTLTDEGELNIYVVLGTYDGKFTVPNMIDGIEVKLVNLYDYSDIDTFVLPDSVETLNVELNPLLYDEDHLRGLSLPKNSIKNMYVGKNFTEAGICNIMNSQYCEFDNLKSIHVSKENPNITEYNGVVFTKDLKKVLFCPKKRFTKKDSTFTLPKGKVEVIGSNAFSATRLSKIKNVLGLKVIERDAFSGTDIEKFIIGKRVEELWSGVFFGCDRLKRVTFYSQGNTIKKIHGGTFAYCDKLEKVYMNKITKAPVLAWSGSFALSKPGIKFYVKDKKVARQLKKEITRKKGIGVRKAKIYAGKKLVYKNVSSKKKK